MTTTRRAPGPVDGAKSPAATPTTLDAEAVTIEDGLWVRRQTVNRDAALPHGFRMLETTGNLENLRIAAGRSTARYRGPVFMDSDVYKWLDGGGVGDGTRAERVAALDQRGDDRPGSGLTCALSSGRSRSCGWIDVGST